MKESGEWDRYYQSDIYDKQYPDLWIIQFIAGLGLSNGARILDLGCGQGHNFGVIYDYGYTPVGIDISETALAECVRRYPDAKVHQYSFDESWKGIEDDSIDAAFDHVSLVCTKLPVIQQAFRNLRRVLKNGAYFKWIVVDDSSDWALVGDLNDEKFVSESSVADLPDDTHYRGYTFFSPLDARLLLRQHGFKLIQERRISFETILPGATRRVYKITEYIAANNRQ